jgi:hypothetical protein
MAVVMRAVVIRASVVAEEGGLFGGSLTLSLDRLGINGNNTYRI